MANMVLAAVFVLQDLLELIVKLDYLVLMV